MNLKRVVSSVALVMSFAVVAQAAEDPNVTRATLANGMKVVIVRNTLAPVVTVETNFLVGGNETPEGFPGSAHAMEHMAFRGCKGMSADQTAAIYAQLGGDNNADTQQVITQYYATVPAADVDVALQAQAACMNGVDLDQKEWDKERGAIEQEVSRDLSNPTYKFINRLNSDIFAGSAYAHDPLGTKESFDKTTAAALKDFYVKWYSPSNAILVIVGDVDGAKTLAKIKEMFGAIPARVVPERPKVTLQPLKSSSFTLDSNLPYVLGLVSYRMPGTDSPDYAAAQILGDVLASQRGDLYAMVPAGKALAAQFGMVESYPKASVGFGLVALPAGADVNAAMAEMKKILDSYAEKGVPEELVKASKLSEISQAQFQRNSIPGLANVWSNALAAEGRQSPDEDIEAIRKVTLADVNRVAKTYLFNAPVITAVLKPVPTGEAVADKGFGGGEKLANAPTGDVKLPVWAEKALAEIKVPDHAPAVVDSTLPNGIRLIVRTDRTSPTITVTGAVKHDGDLQTAPGQDGLDDLLDGLYSYGTTSLDRLAFQKALDDISANESAGYRFGLSVLKENFSRGVQLLADNELHPLLPKEGFDVVKAQTSQFIAGNMQSPGYRTTKTLQMALLPKGDPSLRETTPETLKGATLEQVKAYHAATVRPDLTTIVVIGDVTPEEAKATITKWFGDWKATGDKPNTTLPKVPMNKASSANVPDAQAVQDSVSLVEQLEINRFDADYYPLQLGTHVLGGGFYATRLYRHLRQEAGLVYNVDVGLSAGKTRASYAVTYGCDPDKVSKARQMIEADLTAMQTTNVSDGDLHQAKALLLRQIPLAEGSEDAVASAMLARAELGLPLDESVRAAKKYASLTADEVKAAFARQIKVENLVQVVRGPAPK